MIVSAAYIVMIDKEKSKKILRLLRLFLHIFEMKNL